MRKMGICLVFMLALCLAVPAMATGSWEQINQTLIRPQGWQRIVEQSRFKLGEKTEWGQIGDQILYEWGYGTYPSIDGSTVSVPMAMEFARQHLPLSEEDLTGFVFLSTTHNAYEHLIRREANGSPLVPSQQVAMDDKHPVDIIIVTQPSAQEQALAAQYGVELVAKPVCYDAFVFITHKDNPVESLTVDQIRKIYAGEITNWVQVGGEDAAIIPYQRPENSGSQTGMLDLVMKGVPMSAAKENYVVDSMSGLVKRVGEYENSRGSLGYTYKFYIDSLYQHEDIKILAIEGVSPSDENLRAGAYSFATHYYGVIRAGEEQQAGGLFLDWMLSPEGQRCIRQGGYIPMVDY